jgi:hypothetical protein
MLLIVLRVAATPQMFTTASAVFSGKPVPVSTNSYPPFYVPDVMLRPVNVNGKSKGTTAGRAATCPTWVILTTGM